MQRDPRACLWDVRQAALAILEFSAGMGAGSYAGNALVARSSGSEMFLIHGYAAIDSARVWRIKETLLPGLIETVSALIDEGGGDRR